MRRRPPRSTRTDTLFPYTTLFRSILQFEEALANGGEESFVALSSEIPVRLIYHTAYLDENGGIRFLPDIYGWDAKVAEAMNLGANEPRTIYHIAADRKSVVEGKSVSVSVDLGGRGIIKKKKKRRKKR